MNAQVAFLVGVHDQLGKALAGIFGTDGASQSNVLSLSDKDKLVAQLSNGKNEPPQVTLGFVLDVGRNEIATIASDLGRLPTTGMLGRLDLPALEAMHERLHEVLSNFDLQVRAALTFMTQQLRDGLGGKLGLFTGHEGFLADLIMARDPKGFRDAADNLLDSVRRASPAAAGGATAGLIDLHQLIGRDPGMVLPLATLAKAIQRGGQGLQNVANIPGSVKTALMNYFFKPNGYQTIDGVNVVAPVHLSDVTSALEKAAGSAATGAVSAVTGGTGEAGVVAAVSANVDTLKSQLSGMFTKTTAEHYLRDVIRVIVESAYDTGRGIGGDAGRYADVTKKLKAIAVTPPGVAADVKFVSWFRGFGSLAESGAMRAVEVGTQGVSEFQTNPLIAAAAGSFAGTVARKLAQDSFLKVLKTELDAS